MRERIVVVGGNAAGMTAASRAKRLEPSLDVLVLELSHFLSYSICGLPHYITGSVPRHQDLIAFDPRRLEEERGIKALTGIRVREVHSGRRAVACCRVESGEELHFDYDRLVIATGYVPRFPDIEGLQLQPVLTVSRLEDGIRIRTEIRRQGIQKAAVIGAGYIGLMMAAALRDLGLEVLLLEKERQVFPQVDEEIAGILEDNLREHGVHLHLGSPVRRLVGSNGTLQGVEVEGQILEAQMALVDVGVKPNTRLARDSGIPCGLSGAIQVDSRGQTEVSGIYAAGNCAETRHLVTGRPIFSTLGTTAAKQGRVVGENLAGRRSSFAGSLETSVEKVFDLCVARTGLTLRQAFDAGFEADAVLVKSRDRAAYFPGSSRICARLVYEKRSGRLLGGQITGSDAVAKRIDTLVTALTAKMKIEELAQLDLAYAPPYATLWDPIQIAANLALKKLHKI